MRTPRFSRRDVLKGSSALAAGTVCAVAGPVRRRRRPSAITPELIEAAKKEGKVVYYTSIDLPLAERIAQGLRGEISRASRCGSSAPAPSACSSASARNTPAASIAVDVVNSSDAAHFIVWKRQGILAPLRAGGRRQALSRRAQGRRTACSPASASTLCADRLQHQAGEGRGRAEELRRPARPEMGRQDRQGASGLQRHDPDRDLPDRARPRLGVSSRSSPSRRSCRCSPRPIRRRSSRSASAP